MEIESSNQPNKSLPIQLYPLGDSAVVLQFGDTISPEVQKKIASLQASLEKQPFPGIIELVPAFTTLTIYYKPWVLSEKGNQDPYEKVCSLIREAALEEEAQEAEVGKLVEIPVCYGGEYGPDLEVVAEYHHLSPEEVVAIHSGTEYLVYMIGFAPGFPYLGGLDQAIATPRKAHPRPQIPAGSVGIAGNQTGIYPMATPGGWQLIGRTTLQLFNLQRESPSLLQAGDKVRFVAISPEKYRQRKEGEDGS